MFRIFALIILTFAATWATAIPTVVNCDNGQSLNRTLARMNKDTPATVLVRGTCTEYVKISGFNSLTLKGQQGATLAEPSAAPDNGLSFQVLLIEASRSITIDGLIVRPGTNTPGIGIGRNSLDVRLRNLEIDGGSPGVIVFENSQVSIAQVTIYPTGYAAVGVYDASDVHIEDCLFENSTGAYWHMGLDVSNFGHVSMHGIIIRNMQEGITVSSGGVVAITDFNSYYPFGGSSDVVIESPAGSNFWGVWIGNSSSLTVGSAKLVITNPGQPWGGNSGGVFVSDGGTLNAGPNLVVSGSQGQGVFVNNNSHAGLAGSRITGSAHGGLVAANLSSIAVGSSNPMTEISGNGTDLFCDSKSLITGSANIANATSVQCTNLLAGDNEVLP